MKTHRTAAAVSIALLAAFAAALATACNGAVVTAGAAQNGARVSLHVGDQLFVSLKANATTGFAWKLQSVNKSVLKPRAAAYVPNANPKHLVGVGGVYKLRLKALTKGATTLRLKYLRSWNGESGGSYTLRVVVS
jgi:inhibitor of cysteine peptidase